MYDKTLRSEILQEKLRARTTRVPVQIGILSLPTTVPEMVAECSRSLLQPYSSGQKETGQANDGMQA